MQNSPADAPMRSEPQNNKPNNLLGYVVALILVIFLAFGVVKFLHPDTAVVASGGKLPSIENVKVVSSVDKTSVAITLPYLKKNGVVNELSDYSFKVIYANNQFSTFFISADDCVKSLNVNGKSVTFDADSQLHLCDWKRGIHVDLKPYLHSGTNEITLQAFNKHGPTGLKFNAIDPATPFPAVPKPAVKPAVPAPVAAAPAPVAPVAAPVQQHVQPQQPVPHSNSAKKTH